MEFLETVGSLLSDKGRSVWTADPDMPVYEALALMAAREVGALPVVSKGQIVGLVSERDYARKVVLKGRSSRETTVREIMTSPAFVVSLSATIDECMRLMTEHRVRHLPVEDNGKLAGIVSIGDLVNRIISHQENTIRQLHSYIGGSYPA